MKPSHGATIDIETYPADIRAYPDKHWKVRIYQEVKPVKMCIFGYKMRHLKRVNTLAEWEFDTYRDFLEAVWNIVDNCSYVVGHNASAFDMRQLHSFFIANGFRRPRCKVVDTLKIARREIKLPDYRLRYVAKYVGVGEKMEMGETSWLKVEEGDAQARAHALKYNIRDVLITDGVVDKFLELGYARLPDQMQAFTAKFGCIRCGSDEVVKRGEKPYADGLYQMVCCKNCNKHQPYYLVRKWAHRG